MKNTLQADLLKSSRSRVPSKAKEKPTPRSQYIIEAERIQSEIGDLLQIRMTLGLSQRKICHLLLVDPSAWTRWNKLGAPPHVYQALKWLIELKKINPEAVAPSNIGARVDHLQMSLQTRIKELESQVESLERALVAAPAAPEPYPDRTHEIVSALTKILEQKETKTRTKKPTKRRMKRHMKKQIRPKAKLKQKSKQKSKQKLKQKSKNKQNTKKPKVNRKKK